MRITSPSRSARVSLPEVDLTDPRLFSDGDPHLVWQTLRAEEPVYWQDVADGLGFWSVTRYDDCCRVLGDHEVFTSSQGVLLTMLGVRDPAGGRQMAVSDPPRHTDLRRPLHQLLTGAAVAAHAPRLRAAIRNLLAPLDSGRPWDLGAAMTALPMIVSGVLMGLPEQDYAHLVRWGLMTVAPDDEEIQVGGDPEETLRHAHRSLFAYFGDEVARRRRAARQDVAEDLIDRLMTMRVDGSRLSDGDVVSNCYSLLLGANVNTGHVISAAVLELLDRPEQYARWADPSRRMSGIREALRWSSPVVHFLRYATRDVELRGRGIRRGDGVVAWIPSANRDEEVFEAPFHFDVDRTANREIAFGHGPHRCIGATAGLATLRLALDEIFAKVERFELAGPVAHLRSNFTAGITHLPVVAHARPAGHGS